MINVSNVELLTEEEVNALDNGADTQPMSSGVADIELLTPEQADELSKPNIPDNFSLLKPGVKVELLTEDESKALDEEEKYKESQLTGFKDEGQTLKKSDLREPENVKRIRQYMIDSNGVRYNEGGPIDDAAVVEDFVDHMRNFNTNLLTTVGEVRYISTATDEQKARASEAYQLYDRLGNVFVNDGFFGAVDGVKDYVFAAATDPSNYIGLLTGGLGKAGALAGGQGAKALVKQAAAQAGQKALKNGATRAAAAKAGQEAAEKAIERFAVAKVKSPAAQKAIAKAAELEKNIFLSQAKRKAAREVTGEAAKKTATKALVATTAADAFIAMAQDYSIQGVYLDVGAQEEYSKLQTGFSSLFGAVGGGAQLAGRQFKGVSGLVDVEDTLTSTYARQRVQGEIDDIITKESTLSKSLLSDKDTKKAATEIKDAVRTWKDKWQAGRRINEGETMEADLLKRIIMGEDGTGKKNGLVKVYSDAGIPMTKNMTISDAITNTVRYLPQKELDEINSMLKPTHVYVGELGDSRARLGDLIASEANRAGSVLNVFSQAKRALDVSIVKSADVLERATEGVIARESEKAMVSKNLEYGQNIWRRLLVSSPATTAANVSGFAQFTVGQSLADVLTGTQYTLAALTQTGAKRAEMMRIGQVYRSNVANKMRYLMDPFTTHDAYMKFLKENDDVSKVLFETVSGGVARTADRFGMDPESSFFRNAEMLADGANRWTGVRVQDSFTKSTMFMSEMDKYLQINTGKSLKEVINTGEVELIDDNIIGAALDTTMKSVFSKDYTSDSYFLGSTAKLVEQISNTPVLGTVLPFGRFMNNVVATAWNWSPLTLINSASSLMKGQNVEAVEGVSRTLVGLTALGLAMHNDEERQDKALKATELDVGGGKVVDFANQYPMSVFLVAGRIANLNRKGEMVPKELMQEMGKQVAIAQAASDLEFGNDLNNLLSLLSSEDDKRGLSWDMLYKQAGNIAAGLTRPLDAINRGVGMITGSDAAKDPRQASGPAVFSLNATRYIDNIIEVFSDDIDAITGEELRVATRGGSIRDANPASRIAGFTQKPPQTETEFVFGLAEMLPYTANERTKNPAYDKLFNTLIQPELQKVAGRLMRNDRFTKATLDQRRLMLKSELTTARNKIRTYMKAHSNPETFKEVLIKDARTKGSPEARFAADNMMKRRGIEGKKDEYSMKELQLYLEYIKAYEDVYKQ